jgi:hypothetical protein
MAYTGEIDWSTLTPRGLNPATGQWEQLYNTSPSARLGMSESEGGPANYEFASNMTQAPAVQHQQRDEFDAGNYVWKSGTGYVPGKIYKPGSKDDPALGGDGNIKFGGYDTGFWGTVSDLGNLATMAALAYGTGGAAGGLLGTGAAASGAIGGGLTSGLVSGGDPTAIATGAAGGYLTGAANPNMYNIGNAGSGALVDSGISAAGGATMPSATTAAAGGSIGSGLGSGAIAAAGPNDGIVFNNNPTGGLNPNTTSTGTSGLNPNMATGTGLNGGQLGLPTTTGGNAFNSNLSSGLQGMLQSAPPGPVFNNIPQPSIFNNTLAPTSTGGLNPNVTGSPGLNPNVQTGVGVNPTTAGNAFNSGLSPELQAVLGNGASAGTTAGSAFGSGLVDGAGSGPTAGGTGQNPVQNILQQILTGSGPLGQIGGALGLNNNNQPQSGLPYGALASMLVQMLGSQDVKNTLKGMFDQTMAADPWNSQMGKYQQPLFDAATKGIGDTEYGHSIASSIARQNAARGYNMSGNMATDIARGLNSGTADYIRAMTPLAMGRAPDTSSAGQLGLGMGLAQSGLYNALGMGLSSILNGNKTQQTGTQQQQGGSQNPLAQYLPLLNQVFSSLG